MTLLDGLFKLLVFPGFLTVVNAGLFLEWVDRKIYARTQNRVGPPWFQPWVDMIKLFSKEDVIPEKAQPFMFTFLPILDLALVVTAFLYVPFGTRQSVYPFSGDLIVVVFLLTVSTLILFLIGWYSGSPFARVGSLRAVSQFLAYEVPLVLALLTPAIFTGSWNVSTIKDFMAGNFFVLLPATVPMLLVALVSLQGKLERVPFDAPEAETEIVAGPLTEYGGRRLAFVKLAHQAELVLGVSLLSDLFLPLDVVLGVPGVIISGLGLVFVLSIIRTSFARLRIEDTTALAWKYLIPLSACGMAVAILVRG